MEKKRYALVGAGGRSRMFTDALSGKFNETSALVAIADSNEGRLHLRAKELEEKGTAVATFKADSFDTMIAKTKPDTVIVTTKDCHHDKYICRAMELGCDVITEKPMTTDETKCRRILDTHKKTGKQCRVTFNYRYAPPRTQLKDLLMKEVIGNIVSIDFHWMLDTRHGADYFRRWHRNKKNSGGLLVHKATHHFDLVNWWISSVPETVFAMGTLSFYKPETAFRDTLTNRSNRCLECPEAKNCPFFLDLAKNDNLKSLYLDNEQYDGYYRDGCVFDNSIDIEDTMHVLVGYRNGVTMNYSLHAFMPWEGYTISLNGTKGRIEHSCRETTYINGDGTTPGELVHDNTSGTTIFPHFQQPYKVDLWTGTGGHGGGDPVLQDDIFLPNPPHDPYGRAADHRAGAWSIMTGVAANRSIATGKPITITDLVGTIEMPDYPKTQ